MNSSSLQNNSREQGSILVLVLIVLSSMIILSLGLAYRTRIEIKLGRANSRRTQAYYLALGGIERIKALISQEELSASVVTRICQFSGTAEEEGLFEQLTDYKVTDKGMLTYSLRDEQAYLNINKSDPASWENTGRISKDCQAAILDWIDADDDKNADGAETDFYQRLTPPYVPKNGPCACLKELLFVRAVTRRIYLGERLNQSPLPNGSGNDGQFERPAAHDDENMDSGLVGIFTVYGNGKININTASKTILAALPGLDDQVAETILAYRSGPDGRFCTDDDGYLKKAEELANVEGLTEFQIGLLEEYCCFDSEHFRIFSYARLNSAFECYLMATARYFEDEPQILYVERLL